MVIFKPRYPKAHSYFGELLLDKPSSWYLSNLKKVQQTRWVFNWVKLVWGIHQTTTKLCLGSKNVLGIFAHFGEPCLWLVKSREHSCEYGRYKNKNGWRCQYFTCFGGNWPILTCGRRSLVSGTQNDIVVSWITLWGMIKVYWHDLTLGYIFDHGACCLLRFCHKFRPKLASINQLRNRSTVCQTVQTMFGELKVHLCSLKKQIIVCWTVQSMFGELTVHPIKNGLNIGEAVKHFFKSITWYCNLGWREVTLS